MSDGMTSVQSWPIETGQSKRYFQRASRVTPGGVQGEGRSARPYPLYMRRGEGAQLWDVDDNCFVDFHSGFGAVLLGHNAPIIRNAIETTLRDHGVTFATPHPIEVELAELVTSCVPCAERVVFACTGSEVTYHAIRLARAVTGRPLVLKFQGNYHGWHDYVSWNARADGNNATGDPGESVIPTSAGVAPGMEQNVIVREYNDLVGLRDAVNRYGDKIAAIIVEPFFLNAGVIPPLPGFIEECRALADKVNAVLIFDEIITGFRLGPGGAQERLNITPDLATFGKAFANGMPLSILAGRQDLMDELAPIGPTFFSGTFCGHLLMVACGLACLRTLVDTDIYEPLNALGQRLEDGVQAAIDHRRAQAHVRRLGSVWALYFGDRAPNSHRELTAITAGKYDVTQVAYQRWMAGHGIYIHPHSIIRGYITAAHTADHIDQVIEHTDTFLQTELPKLMR